MTSIKQKVLASVAAAVVAVGGGLAVANVGSGDTASATQGGPPNGQQPGGRPDLSSLASDLGVSESRLQAAMRSARPDQGGDPSGMAADLAEALDVSESKVQAALEANRPGGAPSGQQDRQAPSGTTTTS